MHLFPWHLQSTRRWTNSRQRAHQVRSRRGRPADRVSRTSSAGNEVGTAADILNLETDSSGYTKDRSIAFTSAAPADGETAEDLETGSSLYFTNPRGHTPGGCWARCSPHYMIGTTMLIAAATFSISFLLLTCFLCCPQRAASQHAWAVGATGGFNEPGFTQGRDHRRHHLPAYYTGTYLQGEGTSACMSAFSTRRGLPGP